MPSSPEASRPPLTETVEAKPVEIGERPESSAFATKKAEGVFARLGKEAKSWASGLWETYGPKSLLEHTSLWWNDALAKRAEAKLNWKQGAQEALRQRAETKRSSQAKNTAEMQRLEAAYQAMGWERAKIDAALKPVREKITKDNGTLEKQAGALEIRAQNKEDSIRDLKSSMNQREQRANEARSKIDGRLQKEHERFARVQTEARDGITVSMREMAALGTRQRTLESHVGRLEALGDLGNRAIRKEVQARLKELRKEMAAVERQYANWQKKADEWKQIERASTQRVEALAAKRNRVLGLQENASDG